jgi:hypothetical protein
MLPSYQNLHQSYHPKKAAESELSLQEGKLMPENCPEGQLLSKADKCFGASIVKISPSFCIIGLRT